MNQAHASHFPLHFHLRAAAVATLAALLAVPMSAVSDPVATVRQLDVALVQASAADIPLFAPTHFAAVVREYRAAAEASQYKREAEAVDAAQRGLKVLAEAADLAAKGRELLQGAANGRAAVLTLDDSIIPRIATADEMLRQASAFAEAGDPRRALAEAGKAESAYAAAAAGHLKEQWLPRIRNELFEAQRAASPADLANAQAELERAASRLDSSFTLSQLSEIVSLLKGIDRFFYPPFYRFPPTKLEMAGFVLQVIRYDHRQWDRVNGQVHHAGGTAWLVFRCQEPSYRPPIWQVETIDRELRVVESVKNGAGEISLADAQRIDSTAAIGAVLPVKLPTYAVTASQISQAVVQQVQWLARPAGAIAVRFEDLTIKPAAFPDTGIVLAGTAAYPTTTPDPQEATLTIAGFTLNLRAISLTATRAAVEASLDMPLSIVDPGTGHPGRVDLGRFPITNRCAFRRELPSLAYGPWGIGNTGMKIKGTGVTVDFDPSWASTAAPIGSAAAALTWRGAILGSGGTLATAPPVSNSGYLGASYSYPLAIVDLAGLDGQFILAAPYEFQSFEPFGYGVALSTGHLALADSAVADGQFDKDKIFLPSRAVRTTAGSAVTAEHAQLQLDSNLDLQSTATLTEPIRWGELTTHPASSSTFYEAGGFSFGLFYLAGTNRTNYFPLDAADDFLEPQAMLHPISTTGMQGLTVFFPQFLQVDTVDTPTKSPLRFVASNRSDRAKADWLNFSFGGVHGRLEDFLSEQGTKTDLGPVYEPFYQGKTAFVAGLGSGPKEKLRKRYTLTVKFVSSAVYDANMEGAIAVPQPVASAIDFGEMAFTSTAQISGAKLPMNDPFKLAYWGLDMVKKPGAASGGVISVRSGEIFFTAAGIRETRHFVMPFYLTWGELLASGTVRRLVFDYNGAGQKFDRFGYATSFVRLSDYDPVKQAYLKTAGTISFDVFGARYVNVHDAYDPARSTAPFDSRVVTLADDSDPAAPYRPSDHFLQADWGDGFGDLAFNYDYDAAAQDGFFGRGSMTIQWIGSSLRSSIVLKAERTCVSANDTGRHDFTLGPIAHFGAMSRITGCGCIADHQLERLVLSAALENTADGNIAVRAATYGQVQMSLTPSISSVEVLGDMYLSVFLNGNVEVQGSAKFTVNRDQAFVEGEVNGHFDSATALGLNSVSGDGHLNWHIGALGGTGYQSLQGQLALSVVTPLAGSSAEGGLYLGINAPLAEAWVLAAAGPHFKLNTAALPARLTGMYAYVKGSESINLYVLSGGLEEFVGLGGFVLTPQQVADLNARSTASPVGLPFVIGNVGAHAWGDILGGLVSADGWADLQVIVPYPYHFQGEIGLSACVLWVACGSVDVTVGLNNNQGFFLQ